MRALIVGGGCRGLDLARELAADGHAVRIVTRTEAGRAAIEAAGGECWIGTPDVDRDAALRARERDDPVLAARDRRAATRDASRRCTARGCR